MDNNHKTESTGIMKSILAAHLILLLHVVLIAGVGCLVLFFRGIVQYMGWILLIGSAGVFFIGWLIRRRMIKEGKRLKEMLSLPVLSNRTIEVSILGGMASIKLEKPVDAQKGEQTNLIEGSQNLLGSENLLGSDSYHLRELSELVELLNQNLITLDEYKKFKKKIINS